MPDVNERLDKVEEGLTRLGERMDERFAQVDQRFGSLETEVQKLRVLGEENTTQIKLIAEVQARHGDVLAEHGAALKRIEEALEPLKAVPAAINRCFRDLDDHERRITALEQTSQRSTPET